MGAFLMNKCTVHAGWLCPASDGKLEVGLDKIIMLLFSLLFTIFLFRKNSATTQLRSVMVYTCANNELDKANMLNNYFSKRFTTSLPPLYGSFESGEHLELPL